MSERSRVVKFIDDIRPEPSPPVQSHALQRPLINYVFPHKVVLFTPVRPQEYVERVAGIFLEYDPAKGEQLLALEMAVIADKLLALGADPAVIAGEVRKLENSIRTAMWHQVMGTKP